MEMVRKRHLTLRPERVWLTGKSIRFADSGFARWMVPYREILCAGISVFDRESGGYYEPEIMDITRELRGDLTLLDTGHCRWRIRTDLWDRTAGDVLTELAVRAPYIMIGAQPWLEETEEDFVQIADMTRLMRRC